MFPKATIDSTKIKEKVRNNSDFESLAASYKNESIRIKAARYLSKKQDKLSISACEFVIKKFPEYAESTRLKLSCLRDIDFIIRTIIYSIYVGDTSIIEEKLISDLKECYQSLDLSLSCIIIFLKFLKNNHGLVGKEAKEVIFYINYLLNAIEDMQKEN